MGLFKKIGNFVGDVAKLTVQPIATAVNSISGKETIDLNYSTKVGNAVASVNKKVDSAVNVFFKTFADKVTDGYASKAVNLIRSSDNKESSGNYFENQTLGKAAAPIVAISAAYADSVSTPKKSGASGGSSGTKVPDVSNPINTMLPVNDTDMSLGSFLGGVITAVKPTIKQVLTAATTQTVSPTQSAAGIAGAVSLSNGQISVNQQTNGLGIFSGVQGFVGGGDLQGKASVVPQVAQGFAAQGGSQNIPIGGGYSVNVPSNGTNLPNNQGGNTSTPVWLWPVVVVAAVLLLVVAIFKK